MSSSRDPTARLRAGLNPLLTASLGGYHGHHANTPLSAVSMTSHAFSSNQTPLSAIQPYNPQEWVASPALGPGSDLNRSVDPKAMLTMLATPPPPPPYSPPRSARPMSMVLEPSHGANISAARAPPPPAPPAQRPPTEPPVATASFPPPPGTRESSRERRFGFPSLSRRREQQTSTPVDAHPPVRHQGLMSRVMNGNANSPRPLTLQIPQPEQTANLAPAARRAVSTPAVATPTSARSRSSSQVRWDSAMPVPPPPPGPPPSSARSQSTQSVQRFPSGSDPMVSPPTRRPPPSGVTTLGPVPPTPANWQDTEVMSNAQAQARTPSPDNRVPAATETASVASSSAHPQSAVSSEASMGSLARSYAQRTDKTIRERRTESRTRGNVRNSMDGSQDLSDIVIPGSGGLQRRLTITRGTPRSSRMSDGPRTGESMDNSHESKGTTPRAMGSNQAHSGQLTPTGLSSETHRYTEDHQALAPKALPTPPTGSRASSTSHVPATHLTRHSVINQSNEQFTHATIERFTAFAQKEMTASSDAERVRLFAEFFVSESRIRRERYGAAIGAMGSEILDLTRDLFRPMDTHIRRESSNSATSGVIELTTPQSSEPRSHRGSIGSVFSGNPNSHGQTPITPSSASQPMTPGSSGNTPNANNWPTSNYMPSLSPILSMSVSDAVDEQDSRGRPASRWWEADSSGAPSTKMERSKRESKYMGVPKEAREALQWIDDASAGPSNNQRYSDSEYPPEKVGWHEQQDQTTPAQPQQQSARNSVLSNYSTPSTPNPAHLDVSRLVTLPPPYPRHHPAVNNNHPELTQTRSSVRIISDMTEIDAIKEKFKLASTKARLDAAEAAKQRRQALRQNLQSEIASGSIGYADAAAIETDANTSENNRINDLEKSDFDTFQTAVVVPVNEILQTRITKATELFDSLRSRLFDETHDSNPNLPQEEGDEQPELLEKLTLLKWIFEARETLHRALYDLLSDRNDRYREVVLTPYRLLQGQQDKIASATTFFAEDAAKRALAYHEEVLHRTQQFRDVVEETVVRGVEAQLSAFWDIAPPLKRSVLDNIPASMEGFQIQIPASEYEENPSYVEHPLQYLFSLLLHAEKSTYQFIESQTNLLCLLHEVKEACVSAKAKVMESDGRDASRVDQMRVEEGQRLTEDLKEKVRVVQDQWNEALGETIGGVKERVGGWLLETGGWDESLEDGGVGGV
ncbi:hypothetical protein B0H65DRAFT_496057 [Neurospora tetraspora]|uniref:Uncharacterized protein n=1 Tax=Neurospora tetraspora TaxID=94610 RepID=A0AAE0JDC7_9PEZI|nr:hypothetical protein B0H65DRAFT_496057 [Neurospora tetraspora]